MTADLSLTKEEKLKEYYEYMADEHQVWVEMVFPIAREIWLKWETEDPIANPWTSSRTSLVIERLKEGME